MATDVIGAGAVFAVSILATFQLISKNESSRGAAMIDGPTRASSAVLVPTYDEEDDIPPPSPSRIPRRVLPVVMLQDEEEEDDDDDDDEGASMRYAVFEGAVYEDNDDYDDDDDSDYGSADNDEDEEDDDDDDDDEDVDDSDAAIMAATARSIFADTLAAKYATQVSDMATTITVMKQIIEYAASQGSRTVSIQRHYLRASGVFGDNSEHFLMSGGLLITLDEGGRESDSIAWDNWDGGFLSLLRYPQRIISCSSFLLGEFDLFVQELIQLKAGDAMCAAVDLTTSRLTYLKDKIEKVVDPIQKAQNEEKKWKIICNLVLTSKLQLNPNPSRGRVRRSRTDAEFRVELVDVAARTQVNNDPNMMEFWSHVLAIAELSAINMVDSKQWYAGANVAISSDQISTALDDAYASYVKSQLATIRPWQIESTMISTHLLSLQQSISNKDVNTILRHFHDVYCWKKVLYSLRKDGFNVDVLAPPPPQSSKNSNSPQPLPSVCPKFSIDLWNPLSKAERQAIRWSTYEEELKKHYGYSLPSSASSGDVDEEEDEDDEEPLSP